LNWPPPAIPSQSPVYGVVGLRYRAMRFIDAIYQRFAEEFAGLIQQSSKLPIELPR